MDAKYIVIFSVVDGEKEQKVVEFQSEDLARVFYEYLKANETQIWNVSLTKVIEQSD